MSHIVHEVFRLNASVMILGTSFLLLTVVGPLPHAHSERPSVDSIQPVAGQVGTCIDFVLTGADLEEVEEVVFYRQGLKVLSMKTLEEGRLHVHLESSPSCHQGLYPFRLRSPQGLSEVKTIALTSLPVQVNDAKTGIPFPLESNRSVLSTVKREGVDRYHLHLEAGQVFSAEVEGMRLGVGMIDPRLALLNHKGERLLSADDTPPFRQDPAFSIQIPASGKYTLEVSDAGNRLSEDIPYLLHAGNFPRPLSVFPLGGNVGEKLQFDRETPNFFQATLRADWLVPEGILPERHGKQCPTAIPFRQSVLPNVMAIESRDPLISAPTVESSQVIPNIFWDRASIEVVEDFPVAWNGILERSGDEDYLSMRFQKGQKVRFEVFSSRLGSPVDSLIRIYDRDGTLLAKNDDFDSHDSLVVHAFDRDTSVIVSLTDKRSQGSSRHAYRLEITPELPKVEVFLPRRDRLSQARQVIEVPKGNRALGLFGVKRSFLGGKATLRFSGLPTGVHSTFFDVPEGEFVIPVVFHASESAHRSATLSSVDTTVERGELRASGGFRQIIDLVAGPADSLYCELDLPQLAVATTEKKPFTVSIQQPKASLPIDGSLDLQVEVNREGAFDEPVEVTLPYLPPWVEGSQSTIIPAGSKTTTIQLKAHYNAQDGMWPFVVEANQAKTKARVAQTNPATVDATPPDLASSSAISSNLVQLQLESWQITGKLGTTMGEQGKSLSMQCQLSAPFDLPGLWEATLEGLPNRTNAPPVNITSKGTRVEFQVHLDEDAPIGTYQGIACRFTGRVAGETVSCVVSRHGKIQIENAGSLVKDPSGRPLTRLEVLRTQNRD